MSATESAGAVITIDRPHQFRLSGITARCWLTLWALSLCTVSNPARAETRPSPLVRVVDINVGETQRVQLAGGQTAALKLLGITEQRDSVMRAIRQVNVDIELNGHCATLGSGLYRLPVTVGGVQIDCPVTANYNKDTHIDHWGLVKDARFRLWPPDSPWIRQGTFVYPVGQRWFASQTWFSNEAVSPRPNGKFYYHAGLDVGGVEGLVPVFAATDGRVVAVGERAMEDLPGTAVQPRYDVVYIQDRRGWYYRYSHLYSINTAIRLGQAVRAGQQIGTIGKEGGSGGWSHLHFEIKSLQPSGKWGTQDGYAFMWQAYRDQFRPRLIAVARPRYLVLTGERLTLEATRSWAAAGIRSYQWGFTDGTTASGPRIGRIYSEPGTFSEILKITDEHGNTDVDFAIVKVVDGENPQNVTPGIHPTYFPTFNIRPGDPLTFKVRARGTTEGVDVWDFGDGSSTVTVRSNPNPASHAPDGYATSVHRYRNSGRYIATVRRKTNLGDAVGHLYIVVESE